MPDDNSIQSFRYIRDNNLKPELTKCIEKIDQSIENLGIQIINLKDEQDRLRDLLKIYEDFLEVM